MTAVHLRAGSHLTYLVAPLVRSACTERSGCACSESKCKVVTTAGVDQPTRRCRMRYKSTAQSCPATPVQPPLLNCLLVLQTVPQPQRSAFQRLAALRPAMVCLRRLMFVMPSQEAGISVTLTSSVRQAASEAPKRTNASQHRDFRLAISYISPLR